RCGGQERLRRRLVQRDLGGDAGAGRAALAGRGAVAGPPETRDVCSGNHPDVVVVGAGVVGASCAVHLARAGLRVTVVDRGGAAGSGSTSRATGGFRAQYATAINVRLSLLSRGKLRAFRDETGVDPDFRPVGYLWLAPSAAALARLAAAPAGHPRRGPPPAPHPPP